MNPASTFRVCSTCKTPILFEAKYWACSVSTCNKKGTALYFCSVPCWDAHLPDARHRDAWAVEEKAPSRQELEAVEVEAQAARRRIVATPAGATTQDEEDAPAGDLPLDVLVVVSKLKAFVKARGAMNTSDGVTDVLSDHLRVLCVRAIKSAARNSRKTVLARDFEAALVDTFASE